MDHDETGCQAAPEGPILCVNNCGFFGSAANMNMCSKCYKDTVLKQEQAKFAASSIENFVNESSKGSGKEPAAAAAAVAVATAAVAVADTVMQADPVEVQTTSLPPPQVSSSGDAGAPKGNEGPSRCHSCKKRVGLTGFNCRCGYTFCGSHRYSDKHDCQFDYRAAAQDAIAKANPVVKAEKLDKI